MSAIVSARHRPLALFFGLAALLIGFEIALVRSALFAAHKGPLALAVSLDLTVGLTALFLLFGVKKSSLPVATAAPIFLAGLLGARLLLPESHRGALPALEILAPLIELALIALLLVRSRQIIRVFRRERTEGRGFMDALEEAITSVLGSRSVSRVFASEVGALRFGLFGVFSRVPPPEPGRAFTGFRAAGWPAVAGVLAAVVVIEAAALHLVVVSYSEVLAWIFTALSGYTLVWLLGDLHALRLEPHRLDADALSVRVGLRWRTRIPRAAIVRVARGTELQGEGSLNASVLGSPDVVLTVMQPLEAIGPFGMRRPFTRLGLSVDDPAAFMAALKACSVPEPRGAARPTEDVRNDHRRR